MESVTIHLQKRLEQVFIQKALPRRDPRLDRMSLGELLYLALVECGDEDLLAQA